MRLHSLMPLLLVALAACGHHPKRGTITVDPRPAPNLVSIEIEVYDPETDFVWENVGVRIVEAYNEWSGVTRVNPVMDDWFYTDANGLVYFDERDIADANIGFLEDTLQRALLDSHFDEDEAIVTLEVWSPGFAATFVDVELNWLRPDVFVSVPF